MKWKPQVNNIITLDETYSTTRRVVKAEPEMIPELIKQSAKPEDQFETQVLLPAGENRQGEGGLRNLGYFKVGGLISLNCTEPTSFKNKPLITVVTVVYNGEKFLEDTILSVINQTYENVEYIIIDGDSTDGTLDIIYKYEHAIDYWVSEKDKGIYDAMNKGISLATGEWVNFMNGGDTFYSKKTLDEVFENNKLNEVDIAYGNHQVLYPNEKKRISRAGKIQNLWKGSQFCHQATFVKVKYHKLNKFNRCTKIVADFEFFYNAWKTNAKFKYVDVLVAKFEAGGVSDIKRIDSILGWWLVVDKNFLVNMNYLIMIVVEDLKGRVKKIAS